jgi:hypothetical protein
VESWIIIFGKKMSVMESIIYSVKPLIKYCNYSLLLTPFPSSKIERGEKVELL